MKGQGARARGKGTEQEFAPGCSNLRGNFQRSRGGARRDRRSGPTRPRPPPTATGTDCHRYLLPLRSPLPPRGQDGAAQPHSLLSGSRPQQAPAGPPPASAPLPRGRAGDEHSEGEGTGKEGATRHRRLRGARPSWRGPGAGGSARGAEGREGAGPKELPAGGGGGTRRGGGAARGALPALLPARAGGGAAPIGRGAAVSSARRSGAGRERRRRREGAGLRC